MAFTTPAFVTVATLILLEDHIPPVDGVIFTVVPEQTLEGPETIGLLGNGLIVIALVLAETQVLEFVTVNV